MIGATSLANQEDGLTMGSPLLFGALQSLTEQPHYTVWDPQPATQGLLDYFSLSCCTLYLPACRDALCQLPIEEAESSLDTVFPQLFSFDDASFKPIKLLLLWDLPNYLQPSVLSALIQYLTPRLDPHVVIHSFIYTSQSMPETPALFRFVEQQKLHVVSTSVRTCTCPMYYQEKLHKLFNPFRVQRSILLSNGIQEYVLTS